MALDIKTLKSDIPAGIVVYLVALPLCLGIALASNAPLISGIISGVIGATVVALLSGSQLSVSGPAAGLTVMVAAGIAAAGSYEVFLAAVVLAGLLQVLFGALQLGTLAKFFPPSVIHGMLAGIGIIIILKQLPHAMGRDTDYVGDLNFWQITDNENTFSEILRAVSAFSPGIIAISLVGLGVIWLWGTKVVQSNRILKAVPGPLAAVLLGVGLNELFGFWMPDFAATGDHLVQLPVLSSSGGLGEIFRFPDFFSRDFWTIASIAIPLALVASIETLLCIEATDKIDPLKRTTDKNRELLAQGAGNVVCGAVGGLPITSVIVRSSANVYAGAQSKMSNILHGALLLSTAALIPQLLNKIPLGVLAAVLLSVGYKLARPELFQRTWRQGISEFAPFLATIAAVVLTDLLTGVFVGLGVAIACAAIASSQVATSLTEKFRMKSPKNNPAINLRQHLASESPPRQ